MSSIPVFLRQGVRGERWSRHWFGIGLAVILFFSAAMRLYQIRGFSGEYDEGVHLMVSWLQSRGVPLYTEILTVQFPLLFQPTAWLFELGGPSSALARSLEVGYALLGIGAVAYIGRLLWGPKTALVAAFFLSLERYYFLYSRVFLGSVSSVAVGGLAVLFALYYQATGRRRWLLLAGVVFSFSLLIKSLSLFIGLVFLWAIVARRLTQTSAAVTGYKVRLRHFPWRDLFFDCLSLGLAALVLPLLCLMLYGGTAMFSHTVEFQLYTKTHHDVRGASYVMGILADYARYNIPLLLLATLGIIQTLRRRDGLGMAIIVWLVLGIVFIVTSRAHTHHLVVLDLPLALLAAHSVAGLDSTRGIQRLRLGSWSAGLVILLLAYYLVSLPSLWAEYFSARPRGLSWSEDNDRWAAVNLLQRATTPDQFIVSDDPALAFEARRMVPPSLADPSSVVISYGLVTEQMIMQLADRQGAALVFWTDRFFDSFLALPYWARQAYAKSEQFGRQRIIYYDKRTPQAAHPMEVVFGGEIAMEGYDLSPGTPLQVTFYWRKLGVAAADYKLTLRLLDSGGGTVAQYDSQPYGGLFPTAAWPVGVLLPEKVVLPLADALPPGEYALVAGLYDAQTLELLPVEGAAGGNHNLALLEVLRLGGR